MIRKPNGYKPNFGQGSPSGDAGGVFFLILTSVLVVSFLVKFSYCVG